MTHLIVTPGLAVATATELPVTAPIAFSASTLSAPPAPSADGDWPGHGQVSSRLAELREAAARRTRAMPVFDDSPERAQEAADTTVGMQELQAHSQTWR